MYMSAYTGKTKAQLQSSLDMELDKASMSMLNGSKALSTSPEILTGYASGTNGLYTTVNIVTGVVTAGQTGIMVVQLATSFEFDATATGFFDVYNGTTDTNFGIQRKVSNTNDVGSGAGVFVGAVTLGDSITVKGRVPAGTPTATIENMVVLISWIADAT